MRGFPWWFRWLRICLQCKRLGFNSWVRKTPWRREWKRTPVFLLGKFHEQRNWQATVHGVTRSRTERLLLYFFGSSSDSAVKNPPAMQEAQETWVKSLGWEDALEKGMAIHTSILAWRIPWTKEPGGLQSIGFQRIGHDCSNLACTEFITTVHELKAYLHSFCFFSR